MADDDELTTLGFRCNGSWTGEDLVQLSTAANGIYNILLAVRVRRRLEANYWESVEMSLRRYEQFSGGPFIHELFRAWRESIHMWRKRGELPPFFVPGMLQGFTGFEEALPTDEEIVCNVSKYSSAEDALRVHKIHIASPGGFSFKGIGEIIEEIRELIRDVWYRNRQQRASGDLDLLDKYLRIRKKHPDADLPLPAYFRKDPYLAENLDRHLGTLRELEDRGKLDSVAQHIDYIPPE